MVVYRGGSGKSIDDAVEIQGAANTDEGIAKEYQYLSKKFGQRGVDWQLEKQTLIEDSGKQYDRMDIRLSDGTKKTIYFNITDFFGK